MQEAVQQLTQKERLQQELVKIAPNVTAKDKQDLVSEHAISTYTISRYLRGDVLNVDTATDMLVFFRNRIKQREEKINNA